MQYLKTLPKLEELNLELTHVTDAGLEGIANGSVLTRLWLGGTRVSDAAISNLREARPSLAIETSISWRFDE